LRIELIHLEALSVVYCCCLCVGFVVGFDAQSFSVNSFKIELELELSGGLTSVSQSVDAFKPNLNLSDLVGYETS